MAKQSHVYRGVTIRPCEYAPGEHRGPWVLVSYEHGMPVFDGQSRHCQTLAEAREIVDQEAAEVSYYYPMPNDN